MCLIEITNLITGFDFQYRDYELQRQLYYDFSIAMYIAMKCEKEKSRIHSPTVPDVVIFRSSRPEVFLGKGVLKICSKFTGEHPCRNVISMIFTLRHGCSPVNLLHIFRTPFPNNTSGWPLLNILARFTVEN